MECKMENPDTEIKVGDFVRARAGAYEGQVGTALRVVTTRDEGRTSESVLVSFPAGGADYLNVQELEKTGQKDE